MSARPAQVWLSLDGDRKLTVSSASIVEWSAMDGAEDVEVGREPVVDLDPCTESTPSRGV